MPASPDPTGTSAPTFLVRIEQVCRVLLLAVVIAMATAVTRDFFRYIDHYPYLAVDDGLGNVSYSLATEGRYGSQISPLQGFSNIQRNRGFLNYGPWYFYAGAALIWVFGYSTTVLRSLHLLSILAIAATACWWFGRHRKLASGALVALGLLYSFVGQWPMVRPDIAVSVFAVLFIVAAGRAIETGSAWCWFLAGLGAGCAALTHLIAWALVPCCVFTFAIALASERPTKRRAVIGVLAVALGLIAAATMFYGSSGFRIRDHLATLKGYGDYLGGAAGIAGGYRSVVTTHLGQAFWLLSATARAALVGAVVVSVGLLIASWRWGLATRTQLFAFLLPPAAVLCFYVVSLGFYASYHTGYAILPQVGAWWCAGALLSTALWFVERRGPRASRAAAAAVAVMLAIGGAVEIHAYVRSQGNGRLRYAREWVSIEDYTNRIGELVPKGATAWGTTVFGIDSPGRVELVEAGTALSIVEQARVSHTVDVVPIAPQYLIWGYVDNRDSMVQALRGIDAAWQGNVFNRIHDVLSVNFRLIGLVVARPYGVTRVYERVVRQADLPQRLPAVSAYDAATQTWDRRLEGPVPSHFVATEPALFHVGYTVNRKSVRADRSVVADMPPGRYVLRVRVGPESSSIRSNLLAVTSAPSVSEEMGELGPSFDVSAYAQGDEDAYLVHQHAGGPLYVSQIDKGQRPSLDGVEVYRILPVLHDDQRAERDIFSDMPPLGSWAPLAGVHASITETGALVVKGDTTKGGYQIQSPVVAADPQSIVTLRAAFTRDEGTVCVGALNGTASRWLASGGDPSRDLTFTEDATAGFIVVFHNCNTAENGNMPSRFTVSRVRHAHTAGGMYVDQLLATLNPATGAATIAPDPRLRSFPAGLTVSSDSVTRIAVPLRSSDLTFRAPILVDAGEGWIIKGIADGRFSYVLRSQSTAVSGYRLVAKGRVDSGGVTIGLLKNDQWAGQVTVTTPGPFIVIIEPPIWGATYDIVLANALPLGPLETDVAVERIGWTFR